jgi:hypothetical protein
MVWQGWPWSWKPALIAMAVCLTVVGCVMRTTRQPPSLQEVGPVAVPGMQGPPLP